MAAEEEARARAVLAEMQMRISQGPYAALGIAEDATPEVVRAAFLQLTKQFHPARFARMASELQRLSNEVFLGIKSSHDQLVKALGSSGRISRGSGGLPAVPAEGTNKTQTGGTIRGTGLVPATAQLARGTDPARPPTPTPARTRTGPLPPVGRHATPPMGVPLQRLGSPPTTRPSTPPIARPGTPPQRPTSPIPRPSSPPAATPASTPGRTDGAAFDEGSELAKARTLLLTRQWTAARQALHTLAAKVPQSKQYRALLCYARGRETHANGRLDDAVLEFQRALQLDPDLDLARQALTELGRKSRL